MDLDVLMSVADLERHKSSPALLTPIEKALAKMGSTERRDVGYLIEGGPVQFLPVASSLEEEAWEKAIEVAIAAAGEAPLKARRLRAEHVVAAAVKLGRPKDWARVAAFLEQNAVHLEALRGVLERHQLMGDWKSFRMRAGIEDPLR